MKVSDQIRVYLEDSISKGDLLPGDAIDESALCDLFNVSKTPVREALIKLQAQGWVSNLPRGGTIVAKMNLQQLLSLWELLAELEGVAISLACERMSEQEMEALFQLHEESRSIATGDDLEGWQKVNLAFHELIYKGTRNPFLRQEVLRIRFKTGVYHRHAFGALGRLQASFDQHQLIVDALRGKNVKLAAERMRDHMRPGRDSRSLNDFILNLPADLLASV